MQEECEKGAPKWMLTFGDLMSLLLCFFVLLLSFSTMDPSYFKEVSGSLKQAFGVQRDEVIYEIPKGVDVVSREFSPIFTVDVVLEKIKSTIKLELIKGVVELETADDRVVLRFQDDVTFDPASATLRPDAKPLLDKLRKVIEEVPGDVSVEGFTDDTPIKTKEFPSNWHLSADRAASVVQYLLSKHTIAPGRMAAVGFAGGHPLVPNTSEANRKRNRRVELVFMQPRHPETINVTPITEQGVPEQEILPPVTFASPPRGQ